MDKNEVIRKIKAMKALVDDPNGNLYEQENAARIMHGMINRYGIEHGEFEKNAEEVKAMSFEIEGDPAEWKAILLAKFANVFECRVFEMFRRDSQVYSIVGYPLDIELTTYFFQQFYSQLNEQAIHELDRIKSIEKGGEIELEMLELYLSMPNDRDFFNSFIIGAASAIVDRLETNKNNVADEMDCTDLVVTKRHAVKKWIDEHIDRTIGNTDSVACDPSVYRSGHNYGQSVDIRHGIEGV